MRLALVTALLLTLVLAGTASADTLAVTDVHKVATGTWAYTFTMTHDCEASGDCPYAPHVYQTTVPDIPCPENDSSDDITAADGFDYSLVNDNSVTLTRYVRPVQDRVTRLCFFSSIGSSFVGQYDFSHLATTPPLSASSSVLGKPTLTVTAKSSLREAKFTLISKETQCLAEDQSNDDPLYEYEGMECGLMSDLTVFEKRKRVYSVNLLKNSYFHRWECDEAGKYRWSVRYFNPVVYDPAAPFPNLNTETIKKRGTYVVPRCRPRAPRVVSKGFASSAAYRASPDNEFTSRVDCSAGGASRASSWTCRVTHNNTYRECTDTRVFKFTSKDRYGRKDLNYFIYRRGTSCSYF